MPSSSTTPAGEPADGSEINFDDAAQRIRELTERILDSAKPGSTAFDLGVSGS